MSRSRPLSRALAAVVLAALPLATVAACGDDTGSTGVQSSPVSASDAQQRIADGAAVIDVRTPAEFAAGHLEDAVNIDWESGSFEEQVAELPRDEAYVVYCASGNRATGAVEAMEQLGFTDVVNGGGYVDLAG